MRRLMIAALVVSFLAPASYFLAAASARGHDASLPVAVRQCGRARAAAPDLGPARSVRRVRGDRPGLSAARRVPGARVVRDKGTSRSLVRDTGPFIQGEYHGTHPAVRIYYSPRMMRWLIAGRTGHVPDGAMMVKEQYPPPAARYAGLSDDELPKTTGWTIMIKDSAGSKDGWFWGEFFDGMPFDDDQPPFRYPAAGFGLECLRCHSTTEREQTFASLDNTRAFRGTRSSSSTTAPGVSRPATPQLTPTAFRRPSATAAAGGSDSPDVHRHRGRTVPGVQTMPSETYDTGGPGASGRAVRQLHPVHVVSRRIERTVRADDVPAVPGGAARHRRGQRLAVRRMAMVADGAGRARPDLLRAARQRGGLPRPLPPPNAS